MSKKVFPDVLVLEVTQDDIDNGVPTDTNKCPVARAAIRVLKVKPNKVFVIYGDNIQVDTSTSYIDYLPTNKKDAAKLKNFVSKFDEGKPVKPIRLRLKKDQDTDA